MATVVKTFVFLSDLETFTLETPSGANVTTFQWQSADGSPANGCLQMVVDWGLDTTVNQKFWTTLTTWEGWGVPVNSDVSQVQITAVNGKTIGAASTKQLSGRILDASNVTVHSAGDLLSSVNFPAPSNWTAMGAGTARAVDFLSQDSSTSVRLELQIVGANGAGTTDFRLDTVELTITYTETASSSGGNDVAIPISNIDGLVFMKGFATASRVGGTSDAIGMAALQECSISHSYDYAEARGPESLQPLGVGVTGESLTGSIRHMVFNTEQLQVFLGGTASYSGGTGKTTFTKLIDQEPNPFNLRLKTPEDGSDMEILVYNCLCTNQPIIEGGANREFKVFGVDWRAYGQSMTGGKKLFEVIVVGNQTGAS